MGRWLTGLFASSTAVAAVSGVAAARYRRAALASARLSEEQGALRRVAVLVARGAPPEQVFDAVTEETGRLFGTDFAFLGRYEPDGTVTFLGRWARLEPDRPLPYSLPLDPGEGSVYTQVFRTGRPARMNGYHDASGTGADAARAWAVRSAVGVPIIVGGRVWGLMGVACRRADPGADTEPRLAGFTELVATAIANAESQAQLRASRARIVAAADDARRGLERDLHDGIQQRLVAVALKLRALEAPASPENQDHRERLSEVERTLAGAIEDLREVARGIHPEVLSRGGLAPALRTLAGRSSVPVQLDVDVQGRLPERVEITVYNAVSEALTNAAKHARASVVRVGLRMDDNSAWLSIRDDGVGGADPDRGSGLVGLRDRVEAIAGTIDITSPPGAGTTYLVKIPLAFQ